MVIGLEGLPGAGKTTAARLLAHKLGVAAVCETTQDHPFLESIYDDANRYDFQVELAFLLLHHAAYRTVAQEVTTVTDFSPVKDLLFAEAMLSGKDLDLFEALYGHLYAQYAPPDLVVYLDASPDLCLERIRKRMATDSARRFEAGLDIERLRLIKNLYDLRLAELGEVVLRLDIDAAQTETDVVDALEGLLKDRTPSRSLLND